MITTRPAPKTQRKRRNTEVFREWNQDFKTAETFVYCIVHYERHMAKIGVSKNPIKRFYQIQTGCSDPLTLFAFLPGDRSLEYVLHEHFADRRRMGEWFDNSDSAVSLTIGRMAYDARAPE